MATGRGSKSADRLQAENDWLRKGGYAEEIGRTVRNLIWAGATVAGLYLLVRAVEALAGKQTDASILIDLLARFDVSIVLAWTVGAGGLLYGRAQAKLRKNDVERLHRRIKELEVHIDPQRSSSKLTPRGDTNPEDA